MINRMNRTTIKANVLPYPYPGVGQAVLHIFIYLLPSRDTALYELGKWVKGTSEGVKKPVLSADVAQLTANVKEEGSTTLVQIKILQIAKNKAIVKPAMIINRP